MRDGIREKGFGITKMKLEKRVLIESEKLRLKFRVKIKFGRNSKI